MMNIKIIILFVVFGLVVLSSSGYADSLKDLTYQKYDKNKKEKVEVNVKRKSKRLNNSLQKLIYTPPLLGAPSPSRLVGFALRGSTNDLLLSVLTPEYTGLSMNAQPDVFWYTSKPISKPFQFVEFVLNSDTAIKPILRVHLAPVTKGGIQKVSLSDYNITLKPDVEYTWVISLVPDPTTRSYDLVTSGKIKHVVAKNEFQKTIKQTLQNQQPHVFAQAGFWYDALADIIKQTEKKPKESRSRELLISLLKQVELDQIAKNVGNTNPS